MQAADPRITGVESAEFVDAMGEWCVVTTTGIRTSSRSTGCYVAVSCLATEDGETQTGFGFSVGRELADLDLSDAAADAARRATRLLGATKPASGRASPSCSTRTSPPRSSASSAARCRARRC